MFIGSIDTNLRAIVNEMAYRWKGRKVYVGCSGNATVERIVWPHSPAELHGNDVSLYSCALGKHLAGEEVSVIVKDPEWDWLGDYLLPGIDTIATLLLCGEMFKYSGREELFHRRMVKAFIKDWKRMWAATREKVKAATDGVRLTSFFAGDVLEFCEKAPQDSVFISFPPTYENGYERLYRKLDSTFEWEPPSYSVFTEERYIQLFETMRTKEEWVTLRDHPVPELEVYLRGRVQTTPRAKPVYVYAGGGAARVVVPHQKVEPLPVKRLEGEMKGDLRLMRITAPQMNGLRSKYLSPKIAPATAAQNFAVLVGEEVIGAFSFTSPTLLGGFCDTYMMTDLAISPTIYRKLSKLVLAASLSKEAKALCEMQQNGRVRTVGTTAFTERASSQKYRGLYEKYSQKEGSINFIANAGRWTLKEGFEWWQRHHSQLKAMDEEAAE